MVALGDTVEEAFYKVFHLQAACEVQVRKALWEVGSGSGLDGVPGNCGPAGCRLGSCEPDFLRLCHSASHHFCSCSFLLTMGSTSWKNPSHRLTGTTYI